MNTTLFPRENNRHNQTVSVNCPGFTTEIDPPQLHISLQLLSTAGIAPLMTVATPGIHGAVVIGTQGIGVSTPRAAAVAAATVGLDIEVHAPNGAMLAIGAKHELFAEGTAGVSIWPLGITTRLAGATPKVHISVAPMQTAVAMGHHTLAGSGDQVFATTAQQSARLGHRPGGSAQPAR